MFQGLPGVQRAAESKNVGPPLPVTQTRSGRDHSFTLIEMMMVVFLISVVAAVLVPRIGNSGDRVAQLDASRFLAVVKEVIDEAILTGNYYALQIDQESHSYRFLANPYQWQPVLDDALLKQRSFSGDVEIEIDVYEQISEDVENIVLISPLGDIGAFRLAIRGKQQEYRVVLDAYGELLLENEEIR